MRFSSIDGPTTIGYSKQDSGAQYKQGGLSNEKPSFKEYEAAMFGGAGIGAAQYSGGAVGEQ
jgi:hypothetical protein